MLWRSVNKYGTPPERKPVIVTVENESGERYVEFDIRFLDVDAMKKECYKNSFIAEHPNGIWEWPYEMGAGYWEEYHGNVIAWADPDTIVPYQGD